MAVMEKLKIFVVKEPVVAASCLIAGFDSTLIFVFGSLD
ncbi:alpha/beta-Hydrolases superfamily protein [Zea mays]|uniref:Alpha/beta-Hydrolases superfamily protein n=1 Tax=Zea mays TaxID=4577 RepID=A0A1D6MBG7_MAIZE|nr:alpha/beta-Hydrolases superfamily protein [Zea mays]